MVAPVRDRSECPFCKQGGNTALNAASSTADVSAVMRSASKPEASKPEASNPEANKQGASKLQCDDRPASRREKKRKEERRRWLRTQKCPKTIGFIRFLVVLNPKMSKNHWFYKVFGGCETKNCQKPLVL